jgi:hypothetical protein
VARHGVRERERGDPSARHLGRTRLDERRRRRPGVDDQCSRRRAAVVALVPFADAARAFAHASSRYAPSAIDAGTVTRAEPRERRP